MPSFGVTPRKEADLRARMAANGITEADLDERFVRAGGPGGQKVNKSATCVYLCHRPTGLEVKMQEGVRKLRFGNEFRVDASVGLRAEIEELLSDRALAA